MAPSVPSIDPGGVCVATAEHDGDGLGFEISADTAMAYLSLASDSPASLTSLRSRMPVDSLHFSDFKSNSQLRLSDELLAPEVPPKDAVPGLKVRASYDTSWLQTIEGTEDYGALSGESTDFDENQMIESDDIHEEDTERFDTFADVEEGGGPIVRGDGVPITQLTVSRDTTQLLIGGSPTPNLVPTFLSTMLPRVSSTLIALDVSANFLTSLPSALASCSSLEELNISSNPLRALPLFLAHLTSLRVLIADSTGISTIPLAFSMLDTLHTLSIRRNKMFALPSWLCLLPHLELLVVDDNPFQGPWKALVDPILVNGNSTRTQPVSPPPLARSTSARVANGVTFIDTERAGMDGVDAEKHPIDQFHPSNSLTSPNSPKPLPQTPQTPSRNRSASSYDHSGPQRSATDIEETHVFYGLSDVRRTKSAVELERRGILERRGSERVRDGNSRALRSVMAYLRDMNDLTSIDHVDVVSILGSPSIQSNGSGQLRRSGGEMSSESSFASSSFSSSYPVTPELSSTSLLFGDQVAYSQISPGIVSPDGVGFGIEERKYKADNNKRRAIVREIVESERTYVRNLQELVDIYITPASSPVNALSNIGSSGKETVVPNIERKIVFGGIEALFFFHKDSFLPALEEATNLLLGDSTASAEKDVDGKLSSQIAMSVGRTFISHAAFMKMYSQYINNFDNAVQRIRHWMTERIARPGTAPSTPSFSPMAPSGNSAQIITVGLSMSGPIAPGPVVENSPTTGTASLSASQRKRIREYLKRCRSHARHSQLNLEGYLLLPVQRIPRYRLLLEDLVKCTPPTPEKYDDPLHRALAEISSLATNMNEGKREAESRRKLVQWQSRIRGKFPSPLVQPHRRLIMDGRLRLTRVVRKQTLSFEILNSQGDISKVQVECLAPEHTPRSLVGILCSDLLILCRDASGGKDLNGIVDLWAVLRMQTLPQPASIVHGNALRIVDDKAILYFEAPSTSDALSWCRAINTHIPLSRNS